MDGEKAEEEPLDSGYLTGSANPPNDRVVYFLFDSQNTSSYNTKNETQITPRRLKTESESVYETVVDNVALGVGRTTMTTLNLENGILYQRRQRSFSDPFPCTTKSRCRLTAEYGLQVRSTLSGATSSRTTQTCYFCLNADHCSICSRTAAASPSTGLTAVPQRRVAIITPFVNRIDLLSSSAAHAPDIQRTDSTVIDNIAHNLREIADGFDRRYAVGAAAAAGGGAPAAQFGANLNFGALMNNVMVALRALMAAIVWLVGR